VGVPMCQDISCGPNSFIKDIHDLKENVVPMKQYLLFYNNNI
jgi:hypothetical protein